MRRAQITCIALLMGLTLLLLIGGVAWAAPGGVTNPDVLKLLAQVRQATKQYHDVDQAIADGYAPMGGCVEEPGLGAMGVHYINIGLVGDQTVDELQPEVLVYMDKGAGPKLVGVEYFMVALANTPAGPAPWFGMAPPPLGWFSTVPMAFGGPMNGPMPGHEPGMPWHFDLHAWVWQGNPAGIFADFNPSLNCP